ncbi:uncharacterized protein C4orf54-like [Coregonus clupeaformis]|uniref:uncharacterized protein C4orf54-like n=1 Tax=Coregonus clupeaformis TaxID=59861 RepID=UPI001E1C9C66|nr:uncharacterized protein C4orf54-like [Coregonus clupeaformis]
MTASPSCETTPPKREEKEPLETFYIPISRDVPKSLAQQRGTPVGTKNVFNVRSKASGNPTTSNNNKAPSQLHTLSQSPYCEGFSPVSNKLPVSVKISQQLRNVEERERERESERERERERANSIEADRPVQFSSASAEPKNYLTIPVKSHITSAKQAAVSAGGGQENTAIYTFTAMGPKTQTQMASQPGHGGAWRQEETRQSPQKPSTIIMETRAQDTIYHMPMAQSMASAQLQMYCFSLTMAPQAVPHTQRKMLFDPSTGNYYLVDTPVRPATRHLFDPETGQYVDVDVPMSQQSLSPVPMSMPISPFALSPGSYGPTYTIYPGFMTTIPGTPTLIPTRMQSQLSMPSEQEDSGDKGSSSQPDYMESPYYMAVGSGKSPQAGGSSMGQVQQQGRPGVQGFSNGKQPVISITSQQGPCIIAPPFFDGTTMSFVVEHR